MIRNLLVVVAVALVVRLGAVGVAQAMGYAPIQGDAVTYHGLATSLASGQGYLHNGRRDNVRLPLYPIALALVYRVAGVEPVAGAVAQALLDVLGVLTLFGLTLRMTGSRRSATLAALVFALWPGSIVLDLVLYTEPLYTWLLLLAIWATIEMERSGRLVHGLATGLLFGAVTMTRQTTLILTPLLVIGLQLFHRGAPPRAWRARALALFVFFAALVPWTAREIVVTGRVNWVRDYGGLNLWIGNHLPYHGRAIDRPALAEIYRKLGPLANDEVHVDRALKQEAFASMRAHPVATAWLWAQKLWRFLFVDLRPHHLWIRLVLSAGLALIYLLAARGWRRLPPDSARASHVVLGIVLLYFIAVHVVTYSQMRFAEPVRPLAFALAAHGLVTWWERRKLRASSTSP